MGKHHGGGLLVGAQAKQEPRKAGGSSDALDQIVWEIEACKSRADVATICLARAVEITGSDFGFLGELNEKGRLDTIALSAPAWDACQIPTEQALAVLRDMEIRGIFGKPILQRQTVIVNDPASDTDSVGLPPGHPPITSFLGVPLKEVGHTVGVIALANRLGGYEEANRGDIEELAVALVEMLYRRRAEEAEDLLRYSEQRYRRLFTAVKSYTYNVRFKNGAAVTTHHSAGSLAVTGYRDDDYLSDPYLWINMVHPEERQMVRLHVARVLSCKEVLPIEHRIIRKDGEVRWVRNTIIYRCDEDGQLASYDGMVEDITERKLAEEALQENERKFRSLVESTSDWIWSVDQDRVYAYVSPKAKELLGYEAEEMVGKTLGTFMLPDEAQRVVPLISDAMDSAEPSVRVKHISRHKAGRHVTFETSGVPIWDVRGKLCGYQGISRDVTEEVQTRDALKQKEVQLLAAENIQKRLLPYAPPDLPGFEIAGVLYPAEFAAGDYFDYLRLPDGSVGFVIGDVSGHGFAPALIMASTRVLFHSLAKTHCDPAEILALANTELVKDIKADRFVTLLFGRLEPHTKCFTYASAGHSTGYVLDASAAIKARLQSTSLPLAVLPDTEFEIGEPVRLEPGDTILLLTDGIGEAQSADGEFFGNEGILETVRANYHGTATQIVENLCTASRQFSAGQTLLDDMTAMVIRALRRSW